jgi:antitoxin MazE
LLTFLVCCYNVITVYGESMATPIKGRVIKVGNSQGIRIPKLLLEQSGIQENVEIEVRDRQLIISAVPQSRVGWAEAFAAMASNQDDMLLDDVTSTTWDEEEWEW